MYVVILHILRYELIDHLYSGMSLGLAVAGVGKVTVHGPVGIVSMIFIISKN